MLYQIDLPHMCAGIIINNDIIIEAAPILKWTIGKSLNDIQKWVHKKNGTLNKI